MLIRNGQTKTNDIILPIEFSYKDEANNYWLDDSIPFSQFNFTNMESQLDFYPVSRMVNSVQNNSAECIVESDNYAQGSLF